MGYVAYRETVTEGSLAIQYKAGGFKTTFEIGFDIRLGGKAFWGLKIAATGGTVKINDIKNSLNTIELGSGLRS